MTYRLKKDGIVWDDPTDPKPAIVVWKWYDPHIRSWSVWAEDVEGNQVGDTVYVYTKKEAIQVMKEWEL